MSRKKLKAAQLRRVGGLALLSAALGMLIVWVFPSLSILLVVVFLAGGFWLLFL